MNQLILKMSTVFLKIEKGNKPTLPENQKSHAINKKRTITKECFKKLSTYFNAKISKRTYKSQETDNQNNKCL